MTKPAEVETPAPPVENAAIQRAARWAEPDTQADPLADVFPAAAVRCFQDLATCQAEARARFALAELNSWLAGLGPGDLQEVVASPPLPGLAPYLANYLAAMVEHACVRRGVVAPAWTRAIAPLAEPVFGSALVSLRPYLLAHSPTAFRRRNIFIDASIGDRV